MLRAASPPSSPFSSGRPVPRAPFGSSGLEKGVFIRDLHELQAKLRLHEQQGVVGGTTRRIIRDKSRSHGNRIVFSCLNKSYGYPCPFHVRVLKHATGGYEVLHADPDDAHHPDCRLWTQELPAHREKPMRAGPGKTLMVAAYMKDTFLNQQGGTRTRDFKTTFKRLGDITVSAASAARAKKMLRQEVQADYDRAFQCMDDFLERFKRLNPDSVIGSFHSGMYPKIWRGSFLLLPNAQRLAHHLRPMMFVDYAHLKGSRHCGVITACSLDGDNHIYPIAIALVRGEDLDCCTWFFRMMCGSRVATFTDWLGREDMLVFTDRSQSFMSALSAALPKASNMWCVKHLCDNVKKKLRAAWNSTEDDKLIYAIARAASERHFEKAVEALRRRSEAAAAYLLDSASDLSRWVKFRSPYPKFDRCSSSVAESVNNMFGKEERALPIHSFFESVLLKWCQLVDKRLKENTNIVLQQRRQSRPPAEPAPTGEKILTEAAKQWMRDQVQAGGVYHVTISYRDFNQIYNVRHEDSKATYHVREGLNQCTCRDSAHMGLPCRHIQRCLRERKYNYKGLCAADVAHRSYLLSTQMLLYSQSFLMPDFRTLKVDNNILPPPIKPNRKKQRGPQPHHREPRIDELYSQEIADLHQGFAYQEWENDWAELEGLGDREGILAEPWWYRDPMQPVQLTASLESCPFEEVNRNSGVRMGRPPTLRLTATHTSFPLRRDGGR